MAEAEKLETGAAGATDESLPGTAESEASTPDQGDDQASLTGMPNWTFSGLTEDEVADPAVEPPPPPPPAPTAAQVPGPPAGTIPSPPEPPPLPADGPPPATAAMGESETPVPLLESETELPQAVATARGIAAGATPDTPPGAAASPLPPPPERPVAPASAMLPTLPPGPGIAAATSPPPGAWSAPVPVQPPVAPWLGPVGKRRRPAAVIALSVVTLGIYSLAWHSRVNREMAEFDARLEVKSGASALGVAIPWLIGVLTTLAGAADLAIRTLNLHVSVTLPSREVAFGLLGGIAVIPYLVLLLPVSVVAVVMTLERLRVVQERVGIRPDGQVRPVARACLLLLPVIGGLWHVAAVQSRLNRVWHNAGLASRPDPVRRPH